MALDFPIRVRGDIGEAERLRQLELPIVVRRRLPLMWWVQRHRRGVTLGVLVFAVVAFSRAWTGGALVLDGPGIALYVRLVLDHLGADRSVPYWMPELWAGAPVWAVTPTLPLVLLVPVAMFVGPDVAVKIGILVMQVVGACGAYVLAQALWRSRPAAMVAGILFGLQPLVLSHGALAGSQPTVAVMAAAPWLAWSLRRALRGEGTRHVVVAGLLAGFSVLMQAEYAIGLAVLCGCLLAVEAGRVSTGRNPSTPGQLLGRAGAVVAIGLGCVAYWLVPFLVLGDSFVLSPPALVQGELFNGSGAEVGREIGVFFDRAGQLSGSVGFNREGLLPVFFHLGWAGVTLTLVSVALASRRDRDGTFTAILLSAAGGIWLSTGAVALASSGPAARDQVVPFAVAGLATGLLLGGLLRGLRSRLGRLAPLVAAGLVAFLVAVPYLTPFVTLQEAIPLLRSIRFPRFYAVAPLALALGAAYPVVVAREWAEAHRARSAPVALPGVFGGAVALALVGLFLVDVWPYRSYYRVRPPAKEAAYREVAAALAGEQGEFRLAPTQVDPTAVEALLDTGRTLTVGWPHFVAGKQVWRLTGEPFLAPNAYRERAYGLSATRYQVSERPTDRGTANEAVPAIDLISNPRALPIVRAYTNTVAMATRELTPELAVGLAHRNVGVFTGSPDTSPALAATTVVNVRSASPCADVSDAGLDPGLASQLGTACGLHTWLNTLLAGADLVNIGPGVGAVFRSTTDRLQGISAYLDRPPDRTEVVLHDIVPGGRALGRVLARGRAVGVDEYGLAAFTFDPISGSAGKDYAFVLSCPDCADERVPRFVAGHSVDRPGNLLVQGTVRRDRAAAFTPIYDPVAADPPSPTTVDPSRVAPGRWRIAVDGPQPALVVVAEAWFPGWKARVDGRRAAVVEADGGFVGVPVDAGSHVITVEYERPAAALAGRVVTAATLLILGVLAVVRRRRLAEPATVTAAQAPSAPPPPGPSRPPSALPSPAPSRPPSRPPSPPPSPPASRPPARRPPRRRAAPTPPPPSGEPDWDEVVQRRRRPEPDDAPGGRQPPRRRPGTARWPPEPL